MRGRAIGSWWHLARRFFEVATAGPLDDSEGAQVASWLRSTEERALFCEQPIADQRHAYRAAGRIHGLAPDRLDLIRAALFHDVGKRHSGLGIFRRSIASAMMKLGLPLRGKSAAYVDHGRLGAGELEALGCERVVVEFARHHHDGRPNEISVGDWRLLEMADHPGKPPHPQPPAIR